MKDERVLSPSSRTHGELWEPAAAWVGEPGREPVLEELLDDPIMTLLWKGEGLDPGSARATVLGLREVLRSRNEHGLVLAGGM